MPLDPAVLKAFVKDRSGGLLRAACLLLQAVAKESHGTSVQHSAHLSTLTIEQGDVEHKTLPAPGQ